MQQMRGSHSAITEHLIRALRILRRARRGAIPRGTRHITTHNLHHALRASLRRTRHHHMRCRDARNHANTLHTLSRQTSQLTNRHLISEQLTTRHGRSPSGSHSNTHSRRATRIDNTNRARKLAHQPIQHRSVAGGKHSLTVSHATSSLVTSHALTPRTTQLVPLIQRAATKTHQGVNAHRRIQRAPLRELPRQHGNHSGT